MSIELVKAFVSQKHKTWGDVASNAWPSGVQVILMQSYMSSVGMGGGLGAIPLMIANIAIGAIWAVGIGGTVFGAIRSVFVMKEALSLLPWAFTRIPENPSHALADGRLAGIYRRLDFLRKQHWNPMMCYVPAEHRGKLGSIWNKLASEEIHRWAQGGNNHQNQEEIQTKLNGLFTELSPVEASEILDGLQKARGSIETYLDQRRRLNIQVADQQAILAANVGNIADAAVRGGVNYMTRWMFVDAIVTMATSVFTGLDIVFNLGLKAFTSAEFSAMQFAKKVEDVQQLCTGAPVAEAAAALSTWQSVAQYAGPALRLGSTYLPVVMIVRRIGSELTSGTGSFRKSLPYHCFVLGYCGLTPVPGLNLLLVLPLMFGCFKQALQNRYGVEEVTPEGPRQSSLLNVIMNPHGDYQGVCGIGAKLLLSHMLPHWNWSYQVTRVRTGLDHVTAISSQGFNCAMLSHLQKAKV